LILTAFVGGRLHPLRKKSESLKCPRCGRQIRVSLEGKDPARERDFERFAEANFEILAEGGFSPFDAR